jgi:hypothetical protein
MMNCVTGLARMPSTAEAFRKASTSESGRMPDSFSRSRSARRKAAQAGAHAQSLYLCHVVSSSGSEHVRPHAAWYHARKAAQACALSQSLLTTMTLGLL